MTNPVCQRCGGIKRRYINANRRHLGLSYHRACCCQEGGCPIELNAAFSVDSFLCSGCHPRDAQWENYTGAVPDPFVITGFDGTFLLPLTGPSGDLCLYDGAFNLTNGTDFWAIIDVYADSGCTSFQGGQLLSQLVIHLEYDVVLEKVTQLYAWLPNGAGRDPYVFSAQASSVDLGAAVPDDTTFGGNPRSCDTNPLVGHIDQFPADADWKITQGGTVTVTDPAA